MRTKVQSTSLLLVAFCCYAAAASVSWASPPARDERSCSSVQDCLLSATRGLSNLRTLHSKLSQQTRELVSRSNGEAFVGAPSSSFLRTDTPSATSAQPKPALLGTKLGQNINLRGGRAASGAAGASMAHGFDYDYFVIGGGSGGVRSSRIAAGHGAKVGLAELATGGSSKDGGFGGLGGTCVNVGCVPKKLMVYGAHYSHDIHDMKGYGWNVKEAPELDWKGFMENKNKEIARLNGIYERMLGNAGVEVHNAKAKLVDAHTLDVGGKKVTADKILVAVGGWPSKPTFPGSDLAITSNEAFFLEKPPKTAIVVGGGYIAVEFANIFAGYGTKVTQLYRGDMWLRGFDMDVRTHLATEYKEQGIDVKFNSNIAKIEKAGEGLKATLEDGSTLEADVILYATGRKPRTEDIGLEEAGVKVNEKGAIVVDEGFKTSVDNIFAVGDVIDRIALTPVALAEGHCLADTLFGGKPRKTDYSDVPTAVFSNPPIGTVGLTEEAARKEYGDVHVYRTSFRAMKHTLSGRQEKTLMKLIVDPKTDKVLGVHMVGDGAGEIIQLAGVCLKAGATKEHFDSTIGVHPTSAEELVTMRTRVPDA